MEPVCEKCRGAAAPAAQMKTFEHEGHSLHCIAFVSSCVTCGHQWEDPVYEDTNLRNVEQAVASGHR